MLGLPVADPWFAREDAGDGVTLVSEHHVHPLLRCNVWIVEGREMDLLVDSALGLAPLRPVVSRHKNRAIMAVATHVHGDHVGGLHEFDDRAVHGAEAAELAETGIVCLDATLYGETVLDPYRRAGYDIPDLLIDAVPCGGIEAAVLEREPAPPTRVLTEGDILDLGNRSFEVLHLPGHSPGSIGLWEASTGILFSGDAVYDGPLLDEIDGADADAYVETMKRVRQLPVKVVHGGHEPSFGRARLVALCDAFLRLRA